MIATAASRSRSPSSRQAHDAVAGSLETAVPAVARAALHRAAVVRAHLHDEAARRTEQVHHRQPRRMRFEEACAVVSNDEALQPGEWSKFQRMGAGIVLLDDPQRVHY